MIIRKQYCKIETSCPSTCQTQSTVIVESLSASSGHTRQSRPRYCRICSTVLVNLCIFWGWSRERIGFQRVIVTYWRISNIWRPSRLILWVWTLFGCRCFSSYPQISRFGSRRLLGTWLRLLSRICRLIRPSGSITQYKFQYRWSLPRCLCTHQLRRSCHQLIWRMLSGVCFSVVR